MLYVAVGNNSIVRDDNPKTWAAFTRSSLERGWESALVAAPLTWRRGELGSSLGDEILDFSLLFFDFWFCREIDFLRRMVEWERRGTGSWIIFCGTVRMVSETSVITLSWVMRVLVEPPGVNTFDILTEFRSHEPMCAHNPNLNGQNLWASEGAKDRYPNHGENLKGWDLILIVHLSFP